MAQHFKLASLFRVRRIQEEQASGRLAVANSALTSHDRRVEKEHALLEGTSGESTLAAAGIARMSAHMHLLELAAHRRVLEGEADAAAEGLKLARQAKKSAEILKERHDIRVAALRARADQIEMDERASSAHHRKDHS